MPRMLGLSQEFKEFVFDVDLDHEVTLQEFLAHLANTVSPIFTKAIERKPHTYFEQIRIAIDGKFAGSDGYDTLVHPDSTVMILAPYIDG